MWLQRRPLRGRSLPGRYMHDSAFLNVNTSSTRIELLWDLNGSRAVTEEERERLRIKLAARLDSDGMVRVVASDRRSQQQNRQAADERLARVIKHSPHAENVRRDQVNAGGEPATEGRRERISARGVGDGVGTVVARML